jgi:transcriptional regulator GlxA family with amidase domain
MLETGADPVDAVGRGVGYEDVTSFRQLFRRLMGLPPGDYCRRFRLPAHARPASANAGPADREQARGG